MKRRKPLDPKTSVKKPGGPSGHCEGFGTIRKRGNHKLNHSQRVRED